MFKQVLRQLQNSSNIGDDALSVSIHNHTLEEGIQIKVTFRVDLVNSNELTSEGIENAFYAGLTAGGNLLKPNSLVIVDGNVLTSSSGYLVYSVVFG